MEQLPIFVNLRGASVLLLGKGGAAEAKARLIEAAGGMVIHEPRPDVRLAFVASDAPEADAARLKAAGLLVNVVDRPDLCDFTVPAIVDRAPVTVAVGTAGASATLAKVLRERLEAWLPASLGSLACAIFAARGQVTARLGTTAERRRFWDRLLAPGGSLDPLDPSADPSATIGEALASGDSAAPARLVTIAPRSADPDDLTLRELRALSAADTLFHAVAAPAAVLDRARRDAARSVAEAPPASLPPGLSVHVGAVSGG